MKLTTPNEFKRKTITQKEYVIGLIEKELKKAPKYTSNHYIMIYLDGYKYVYNEEDYIIVEQDVVKIKEDKRFEDILKIVIDEYLNVGWSIIEYWQVIGNAYCIKFTF